MAKKPKTKHYRLRAVILKTTGIGVLSLCTIGAFFLYEGLTNWDNFQRELQNFVVVSDTLKLNLAIAFPLLSAILIIVFIILKKNKAYFKDKVTMGILIALCVLYLVYCVIEISLVSLAGALIGSSIDEFVFEPLAKRAMEKADEAKEINKEFNKERKRIEARKKVEAGLDGSV